MLAGEISNIYKKGGKTRKVHNVVFAPSLEAVAQMQARLERIGNIRSDGRPILGLPSRDLLEIILEVDERCHLIPAHIWTPWFALLGSMSGYDSVAECFDDLTPHIFALETGLSSDPPMNWRVSDLDRYTLVSNSDAHSPQKLAREATLFDTELSYDAIFAALKTGDPSTFLGTIEFFPEEGKYHYDGHRKCDVSWDPPTTLAHHGICPVCGKEVTIGVMHRVEILADRPIGDRPARTHPFYSLIPLPEILAELHGVGVGSKAVAQDYDRLLASLGPELGILLRLPLDAIAAAGGEKLAAGIGRMRQGQITALPGYDGEYGVIKLFDSLNASAVPQLALFADEQMRRGGDETDLSLPRLFDSSPLLSITPAQSSPSRSANSPPRLARSAIPPAALNPAQRAAVLCTDVPLIIVAGPGTGKTRTLTARIAHLIQEKGVAPEAVLAITFTNKAAAEMVERLQKSVGAETAARITIKTFHAFGALLLRAHGARLGLSSEFVILTDDDRQVLLKSIAPDLSQQEINQTLALISTAKNQLLSATSDFRPLTSDLRLPSLYQAYEAALRRSQAVDFDDLILLPVRLFETHADVLATVRARYRWVSVDEYQDINLAQYRLLRLLTSDGANLCVIGDPDQAIYGFRGADYRYFLQFEQDYPHARRLHLSQNYRSTQLILDAGQQVIARNPNRQAVEIFSDFVEQVKLDVYDAPTDKAEAEYVVHQIEQMVGGTSYFSLDSGRVEATTALEARTFADFAVLYRLNAQSRALIEAFDRSGIPYQTVGQTPFYAEKDVRKTLAWLWLLLNPSSVVHRQTVGESRGTDEARQQVGTVTVAALVEQAASFTALSAERRQRLAAYALPFAYDLAAFLAATVLHSETDYYDPRADRVTLMTLHAAKGLEFPVVFIVGCEEGLLPYLPENRAVDIEEERRLFYVGMTRAQRKLVLTHARSRFLFGQRLQNRQSRFVDDIESALKELREMERSQKRRDEPEAQQLSLL